jgi:hypothetical protein
MSRDTTNPHSGSASMDLAWGTSFFTGGGPTAGTDPAFCAAIGPGVHPASFWYANAGGIVEMSAAFYPGADCTGTPSLDYFWAEIDRIGWQQAVGVLTAPSGTQSALFSLSNLPDCDWAAGCIASASFDDLYVGDQIARVVSSVSPRSGPAGGGTQLTITGTGFRPGDKVFIGQGYGPGTGAIPATAVRVNSSTQITATTGGPARPGTWDLYVIAPDGTASLANRKDVFTYGPVVSSVSPSSGPAGGGTQLTITGKVFRPGDKVVIGQGHGPGTGAIPATAVSVDSWTQITATTGGPAKPGNWTLYVIAPDGTVSLAPKRFTYTAS